MFIKTDAIIEKASKLKEGEVEFIVSTNDLDSHGEKINVDGIDFKNYKKNPVILWGHDGYNLPIARTTKIWKENGKLMAKAMFYLKDEFANKVYNYIMDGFLKAVSIGGMVKEWSDDGMTVLGLDMKEFSVVSIGANPKALVTNKSLSGEQIAELNSMFRQMARKSLVDGSDVVLDQVKTLETLVATLKEVAISEPHEAITAKDNKPQHVVLKQAQVVDKQVEKIIVHIKKGTNK